MRQKILLKVSLIKNLVIYLPAKTNRKTKMTTQKNYTLTKAELQAMEILWSIGKACDVHEVVERYAEPRPAYTTVSTFMKILSTKGFVDFKKGQGKQHLYFPLISKDEYTSRVMRDVKNNFFGGSVSSFLSFFLKEENLSQKELEELITKVQAPL